MQSSEEKLLFYCFKDVDTEDDIASGKTGIEAQAVRFQVRRALILSSVSYWHTLVVYKNEKLTISYPFKILRWLPVPIRGKIQGSLPLQTLRCSSAPSRRHHMVLLYVPLNSCDGYFIALITNTVIYLFICSVAFIP